MSGDRKGKGTRREERDRGKERRQRRVGGAYRH